MFFTSLSSFEHIIQEWFILLTKYCQGKQIKEDEKDEAFGTMEENANAYKLLEGKTERKRPLGRYRQRQENNVKMNLEETG